MLNIVGLLDECLQSDLREGRKSRDRSRAKSWREVGWHPGPDSLG